MKSMQFAVAILILVICISSAEALRCNRCVPISLRGSCGNSVETCRRSEEVCASVSCTYYTGYTNFKRCMKPSEVFIMKSNPDCQVFTCTTDRCNRN